MPEALNPDNPTAKRFTRKKEDERLIIAPNKFIISEDAPVSHKITRKLKNDKAGKVTDKAVITKILEDDSESDENYTKAEKESIHRLEVYCAWLYRLQILDGNQIPKYSISPAGGVISREIMGFISFGQIKKGIRSSRQFANELSKRLSKHNNIRAFAQILVSSILYRENDLKPDHIGFDSEGRLTRFDFDQSYFVAGLGNSFDFTFEDFENLPVFSKYSPYNFIFNKGNGHYNHEEVTDGIALSECLGAEFKDEVYEAILKHLITPTFLNSEMFHIFDGCSSKAKKEIQLRIDHARITDRCNKLFYEMSKSPGFRKFIKEKGDMAFDRILQEILQFRDNNSHFRKKWNKDEYSVLCKKEMRDAFDRMNQLMFGHYSPEGVRSKLLLFLKNEVARLNKNKKKSGKKAGLYEEMESKLNQLSPDKADFSGQLIGVMHQVAVISHHKRGFFSRLFGWLIKDSKTWVNWKEFHNDSKLNEWVKQYDKGQTEHSANMIKRPSCSAFDKVANKTITVKSYKKYRHIQKLDKHELNSSVSKRPTISIGKS